MFKKNRLALLLSFSVHLFSAAEDQTDSVSLKRSYDRDPVPLADYIVTLNCKKSRLDSDYERNVDPLKLQKLVYYAFSHIKVNFGINLWDIDRYPLIAYSHGPFSWIIHHDGYTGRCIMTQQIDKAYARTQAAGFDQLTKILLKVVNELYKEETGLSLRAKSHMELPYLRVDFQRPLSLSDIQEEFSKFEHRLSFVKALFTLPEEELSSIVTDSRLMFKGWKIKEFSALLEDEQAKHYLPSYAKNILGRIVYPEELVQNVDAKDNLFGRSEVIERLAISAGFGNKSAIQNLAEMFMLYNIEENDIYDQTAQYLQSLESSIIERESSIILVPNGLEEYHNAQKQTTYEAAERFYLASLEKGYARSAFELAKIEFSKSNISDGVKYLKEAFEKGMLTATDMLLPYLNNGEKIDYLRNRGDAGDSYGYYELARLYESQDQMANAIEYYFKAQPFFGYTELATIQKRRSSDFTYTLNENALTDFFKDIIQILNIDELNTMWKIE